MLKMYFLCYVYAKITYVNGASDTLKINNRTIGETTEITNLSENETVTLDGNMLIMSDKPKPVEQ